MILALEVWQAVILWCVFALVFCWAGYATAQGLMLSEVNIKQKEKIKKLETIVKNLQTEKMERDVQNELRRYDKGRNGNNTVVKK